MYSRLPMPFSGGPTSPFAPGTPEIVWQPLQPYFRISSRPARAIPPPVVLYAARTRCEFRSAQPVRKAAIVTTRMRANVAPTYDSPEPRLPPPAAVDFQRSPQALPHLP